MFDWIIVLMNGTMLCEDCYHDSYDWRWEQNHELHVRTRVSDGVCEDCGGVVDAGKLLDEPVD